MFPCQHDLIIIWLLCARNEFVFSLIFRLFDLLNVVGPYAILCLVQCQMIWNSFYYTAPQARSQMMMIFNQYYSHLVCLRDEGFLTLYLKHLNCILKSLWNYHRKLWAVRVWSVKTPWKMDSTDWTN